MMGNRENQTCHGFSTPCILPVSGTLSVTSVHLECKSWSPHGKGWQVFWDVLNRMGQLMVAV